MICQLIYVEWSMKGEVPMFVINVISKAAGIALFVLLALSTYQIYIGQPEAAVHIQNAGGIIVFGVVILFGVVWQSGFKEGQRHSH